MNASFDHEKLNVYRQAISFNGWVGALLERVQSRAAVKDQLDRVATSDAVVLLLGARYGEPGSAA